VNKNKTDSNQSILFKMRSLRDQAVCLYKILLRGVKAL